MALEIYCITVVVTLFYHYLTHWLFPLSLLTSQIPNFSPPIWCAIPCKKKVIDATRNNKRRGKVSQSWISHSRRQLHNLFQCHIWQISGRFHFCFGRGDMWWWHKNLFSGGPKNRHQYKTLHLMTQTFRVQIAGFTFTRFILHGKCFTEKRGINRHLITYLYH